MSSLFRVAAVAAALSGALPAHALSMATVTIGQPIITVTDLDPSDGIAPSYQLGGPMVYEFQIDLGAVNFQHRVLEGDASIQEGDLDLTGSARGTNGRFIGIAERWVPGYTLTASANTRVTVELSYELGGAVEGADPTGPELPRSEASIELGVLAINNLSIDPTTGELVDYRLAYREFTTASLQASANNKLNALGPSQGTLALSFDNLSGTPTVFSFRSVMSVTGFANDMLAPVPEPSQWALALAGLGLLAAVARRRSPRA